MSAPFTLGTPVPSILWLSLEAQLAASMRMFARDIAKTLGRPEGPLLQALQADKICPYTFEESEEKEIDMCCPVMCVKPEAPSFLQPCRNPVVWTSSSKRCVEHLVYRRNNPSSLPELKRLEHTMDGEVLYVSEDSTVYLSDNTPVGEFVNGNLTLFTVIDD